MKILTRGLLIVAFLGTSLLGGFLASRLLPGSAQAAPLASLGLPVVFTLFDVPNMSTNPDVFGTTPVKVADVGTFTVQNGSSMVEVTHQGRLYVQNMSGTTGVYFELRVDGLTGMANDLGRPSGVALIRSNEINQYVPNTFSGYWQGLSAGPHTVSIWVHAASNGGTGDTAVIDPGGWDSNIVVVKEYLPFGSTFLPMVTGE